MTTREKISCCHLAETGPEEDGPCPNEATRFVLFKETGKVRATCDGRDVNHSTGWMAYEVQEISRNEFLVGELLET